MQNRIRVRRERPSVLSWAIALAVTMLAVYLVTLNAPEEGKSKVASAGVRVTRELEFADLTVHFADLGCHADQSGAHIAAAGYAGRGAAGIVYEDADGFHVLGAGYALETDAQRIAERLGSQEGITTSVLTLSAPSLSLRVTAPEEDVEAIAAADRVLRTQLSQLSALALQVDRGEVSAASARTLAKVAQAEVRTVRRQLESIAGGEDQPVCAAMTQLLCALEADLANVNGEGAVLSGQLRCCHARCALGLIDFLKCPSGKKIQPNA